jgi:3-methyladenine DNA glycosylase AlkC
MSLCPTQVYKGVKTLDRSLVLHEKTAKMTSEGARYSCPTAKIIVNLKPETK